MTRLADSASYAGGNHIPEMPPPLVSIVIPTYKPDFLDEAIESALAQTYPKTEIVISDNCRGDEVRDVSRRYPQIRYHRNPETGVYNNFRSCIRLAGGEFVKFLLDDDLLERNCIDRLVSAFELAPDITLTCGWYRLINDRGNEVELRRLPKYDTIMSSPGGAAAPMLMSARNPIGPLTTCMFRKKSFPLGMGPWFFNPEAPRRYLGLVDMAIILDLAFAGRVAVLAEPLSSMRTHALQLSNPANNPRAVSSIRSRLTLAEDAHAFGLLSESQFSVTLDAVLALFRRFRQAFPPLENDIARLEEKMASRAATAFPSS